MLEVAVGLLVEMLRGSGFRSRSVVLCNQLSRATMRAICVKLVDEHGAHDGLSHPAAEGARCRRG